MSAGGSIMGNKGLIAASVLLTVICLILGTVLIVMVLDEDEEASLFVDEVYFIGRETERTDMAIDVEVWLTNEGKGTVETVSVNVFAVETDSNLARANASMNIGEMKGKRSSKAIMSMEVPLNDTYRIEVLVFKDGKLTITGSGILDLTKAGYPRDYGTDRNLDEEKEEKKDVEAESTICVFIAIIGMGILVLVVVLLISLASKTDQDGKGDDEGPERRLRRPPRTERTMTSEPISEKGLIIPEGNAQSMNGPTDSDDTVRERMPRSLE